MPQFYGATFLTLALALLPLLSSVICGGFPASLTLERSFPASRNVELAALRARDRSRHGRLLQGAAGVVDFSVLGSADPFTVGTAFVFDIFLLLVSRCRSRLYFSRVKLGTPPKEFYVQIDTGSDILWIDLEFFSPAASSTASLVSCSDEICSFAVQSLEAGCSVTNSQCNYSFVYGDGSGTAGYYVSDTLYFDTVVGNDATVNSSTSIVFGATQSGDLTKPDRAIDGIFGFGQHDLSVVSQLSSRGIAPKVFSHCLKGSNNGGGVLVLGEIMEPGIVYTPLVQSQPHYNLNLQSISVNGKILSIDPSVFATSSTRGTIVDSGTTLAYLAEEAYDPFINAITAAVSPSVHSFLSKGSQCFVISSSVDEIFPSVSLNFEAGASLVLKPEDYLLQQGSVNLDLSFQGKEAWDPLVGELKLSFLAVKAAQELAEPIPEILEKQLQLHIVLCKYCRLIVRQSGRNFYQMTDYFGFRVFHVGEILAAAPRLEYFVDSDLVLKDKIFVYDLVGQRIGWTAYDCSLPVNVSSTSSGKNEFLNTGQLSVSGSPAPLKFIDNLICVTLIVGFFVHSLMFELSRL
ncbi:hypothetical protein ACLOJK_020943 [Asimina triloba]